MGMLRGSQLFVSVAGRIGHIVLRFAIGVLNRWWLLLSFLRAPLSMITLVLADYMNPHFI